MLVHSHRALGLVGGGLGCWKLEVCPCVHTCVRSRSLADACGVAPLHSQFMELSGVCGRGRGALEGLGLLGCFQTPLGVGP